MPPLECANFLECENKTVCMAHFGSIRPSFWIQPQFFSIIYQKIITIHPAEVVFSFFWGGGQNGLECDSMWNYRHLTRKLHLPHIPENVIPGDFSKKKRKKKKRKKKHGVRRFYGVRRSSRVGEFYSVYVPSCGVRCPMWSAKKLWNAKNSEYAWLVQRPQREISGPEPKFQSQSQPKLPGAHQLVGSVFPSSPWVRPRGRNWLIFTQPTFKNVTFDNPVLLR